LSGRGEMLWWERCIAAMTKPVAEDGTQRAE
jgi:hypothetical protein